MKVLCHIHTFNDEDVIEQCLESVTRQTRQPDSILLVDNASTDSTLERTFAPDIEVIRNQKNVGTNGAVNVGLNYAIEHNFDWAWILDADSAPRPDALEKLLGLWSSLDLQEQKKTWLLASLVIDVESGRIHKAKIFTDTGVRELVVSEEEDRLEIDAAIWSGSLYKISAAEEIGLPDPRLRLDWGEYAYGYAGKLSGKLAYLHPGSIVDHNIGGSSMTLTRAGIGPLAMRFIDLPPIRCYYQARNALLFWLYDYRPRNMGTVLFAMGNVARLLFNFAVRPIGHGSHIKAVLWGILDGAIGRREPRY